jgi:hypothetical protein
MVGRSAQNGGSRTATLDISAGGKLLTMSTVCRWGHQLWDAVYIYIYIYIYIYRERERERERNTNCCDIQAFIVDLCYTDGFTARWR